MQYREECCLAEAWWSVHFSPSDQYRVSQQRRGFPLRVTPPTVQNEANGTNEVSGSNEKIPRQSLVNESHSAELSLGYRAIVGHLKK